MKVLHISSDFYFTEVYDLLFRSLNNAGATQVIFTVLKKGRQIPIVNPDSYEIISASILTKFDSLFFYRRKKKGLNALLTKTRVTNFDFTHAHFLFTDGALALELYEKFGIPYVVTVRNTDISIYFKYFLHLKSLARKIMNSAENIIFVSPGHRKYVESILLFKTDERIKKKFITIPNGINLYWHQNIGRPKNKKSLKEVKFLFVGEISKNKNLPYTIDLLAQLETHYEIRLDVVGKKSDGFVEFETKCAENDWVKYHGEIKNKNHLREHYYEADIFIMLSKFETFGLVYIEAMSQGTPVIYSEGQGVDGYFKEGSIGYNFPSKEGVITVFRERINRILNDYGNFSLRCIDESKKFNWDEVSKKYLNIYGE